jgi:hypothetical protein
VAPFLLFHLGSWLLGAFGQLHLLGFFVNGRQSVDFGLMLQNVSRFLESLHVLEIRL